MSRAASFMSAPAAIAIAKLMVPEDQRPATLGGATITRDVETLNAIDAAASGAAIGTRLALNIGGMLIAFVAIVYLLNAVLGTLGGWLGYDELSFEGLLGTALAPVAWLLGVPPMACRRCRGSWPYT